ncbi:hypothetical protein ACQB6R_02905 [Propionibacteriaceae bacterium G1746]|uniref:hypothetical protein n=1 Tax=Aestuariimicrobium sp. G57 TaxID=3418485 RepID=UPI003C1D9AD0
MHDGDGVGAVETSGAVDDAVAAGDMTGSVTAGADDGAGVPGADAVAVWVTSLVEHAFAMGTVEVLEGSVDGPADDGGTDAGADGLVVAGELGLGEVAVGIVEAGLLVGVPLSLALGAGFGGGTITIARHSPCSPLPSTAATCTRMFSFELGQASVIEFVVVCPIRNPPASTT